MSGNSDESAERVSQKEARRHNLLLFLMHILVLLFIGIPTAIWVMSL